ncbi:MAG: cell surface protein SprA, partial [Bacteroidales bacterium]|nr:cell surface protein SprA [Bacteroidales bacterium]
MRSRSKVTWLTLSLLFMLGSAFGVLSTTPVSELYLQDPQQEEEKPRNFPIKKTTHTTVEDLQQKVPLDAPLPEGLPHLAVKTTVEYDLRTGSYVMRTRVGETEIATPFTMSDKEFYDFSGRQELSAYWKELNAKNEVDNEDKFSITDMKFSLGPADKVFGPGGVQIKTQGSAELVFGIKSNKLDNPALTERMRKTTIFDFDEKIQLNVTGNVGDKVNFNMNYNTESTFDFDQKMLKLNYKGNEDDIIQSIQAGNVSMQLNSSLISGSTALFGVRTDLKFGKLNISAIASQQESETQTVSSKGG